MLFYLEVLDAVVDTSREDLVFPTAPCLGDYLDDLLQGTAHSVEHGVFVDPRRLTVWVPEASLRRGLDVKCQPMYPLLLLALSFTLTLFYFSFT